MSGHRGACIALLLDIQQLHIARFPAWDSPRMRTGLACGCQGSP